MTAATETRTYAPLPGTPPKMTVTVERFPGGAHITVEHDPRQSYARAVRPAMNRAAQRNFIGGYLAATDRDHRKDESWGNDPNSTRTWTRCTLTTAKPEGWND